MSDLSTAVDKLRSLSPHLNAAVVEADRVVRLVERFLVDECGLGVEAEVPLQYNDKGKVVALLRYASVNGAFRITVTHTDGSTHFVARPWSECDRNQRLVSFASLPKLLISVAKAVEMQIASTTSTATTVGQIISALGVSARYNPENTPGIDSFMGSGLTLLMGEEGELAEAVENSDDEPFTDVVQASQANSEQTTDTAVNDDSQPGDVMVDDDEAPAGVKPSPTKSQAPPTKPQPAPAKVAPVSQRAPSESEAAASGSAARRQKSVKGKE